MSIIELWVTLWTLALVAADQLIGARLTMVIAAAAVWIWLLQRS